MPDNVGNQSIFSTTKEDREEIRQTLKASRRSCLSRLNKYTEKLKPSHEQVNGYAGNGAVASPPPAPSPVTEVVSTPAVEDQPAT